MEFKSAFIHTIYGSPELWASATVIVPGLGYPPNYATVFVKKFLSPCELN